MSGQPTHSDPHVIVCSPENRPAALRALEAGLLPSQKSVLVDALIQEQSAGKQAYAGLFFHESQNANPAAVWLQELPGKTGVLWPPDFAHPHARALLAAAVEFASERALQLVQLLVLEGEQVDEASLAEFGINRLVDLDYLWAIPQSQEINSAGIALQAGVAARDGEKPLTFHANANSHPKRLAGLISNTYVGTLDCPHLNGVRDLSEVIDGYRAQGRMMPEQWYTIGNEAADIGVLILADHTNSQSTDRTWELVYMGVLPEFRGRGYSQSIVGHALRQASEADVTRLVLAVDSQNEPAKHAYLRAGFQHWQRRIVYARLSKRT